MLRGGNKWDRRIGRAHELAGHYPFAAEVLTFYSKLTAFQQSFYSRLQSSAGAMSPGTSNGHLPPELSPRTLEVLTHQFRPLLSFLMREGTPALSAFARDLEKTGSSEWAQLLARFWPRNEHGHEEPGLRNHEESAIRNEVPGKPVPPQTPAHFAGFDARLRGNDATQSDLPGDDSENLSRFIALAFLQTYAEYLAGRADVPKPVVRRPMCPFCGSKPLAGVLRPEGDGAKRSLVCSFCHVEWDYLRIACPACQESRDDKMCVYIASQFEHVRLEACETCRTYLKAIDLTKNGLAVPEVDEIAAMPLTLWADEKGYTKLCRNIFGS